MFGDYVIDVVVMYVLGLKIYLLVYIFFYNFVCFFKILIWYLSFDKLFFVVYEKKEINIVFFYYFVLKLCLNENY